MEDFIHALHAFLHEEDQRIIGEPKLKMAISQNVDFRDNFHHNFVNILGRVIIYISFCSPFPLCSKFETHSVFSD